MQSLVLAMQNAVPAADMGVASAVLDVLPVDRRHARHRGLPVHPVLDWPTKIAERFQAAGVRVPAGAINLNASNIQSLPPAVKEPILAGFSDAMNLVFLVGACVLVGAFVLSLMMKEVPLRPMSGIAQLGLTPAQPRQPREPGRARCGRRAEWLFGWSTPDEVSPAQRATTIRSRLLAHPAANA